MSDTRPTEAIEADLREVEFRRLALLEELREQKSKSLLLNPALSLDDREYPDTAEKRVALFEKLFVARTDVYPRYWENQKTRRKGYSPACESIWEDGRRLKATEIYARYGASKFHRLDASVIEAHLRGQIVVGTYAIRNDDTCIFLAADFDGDGWKRDAAAYRDEASRLGIHVLVEISRSGNGAHVWILFHEPVAASLARRLGSLLLARAAASHPGLRMDAYDRFFPNQDTMPKGGFGNLIALPLQKERREQGFTEFVDESFSPHPDQWKELSEAQRIGKEEITSILEQYLEAGIVPETPTLEVEESIIEQSGVNATDLPVLPDWKASLAENVTIPTKGLSDFMLARLKNLATFPNPVFYEKQRQRFPTYNIPRCIFSGELHPDYIVLPRGTLEDAIELFAGCGSRLEIEDRRLKPKGIRIAFKGSLHPQQNTALRAMLEHEHGVLVAPPGSGKTVIACSIIGKRKTPTLILLNRQVLLEQWMDRLQEFLGLEKKEIGQWRGSRKKLKGSVDIAMIQTLANVENPKAFFRDYGMVIIDECHHIPAVTLEALMKECGSKYILGLTATPQRKDRLERLLFHQCGSIRHALNGDASHPFENRLRLRSTAFQAYQDDGKPLPLHLTWQRMIEDEGRNRMIVEDIFRCVQDRRKPIVLSDRKEHLEKLHAMLSALCPQDDAALVMLEGTLSPRQRQEKIDAFTKAAEDGHSVCMFATCSLLGEGFDLPILDTLFLTMPISFKGRLVQYAGRLHRPAPSKEKVVIYDYLDELLPLTMSMYRRRLPGYRSMGYEVVPDEGS
jgi:superfamily II DNA or RNA helicase